MKTQQIMRNLSILLFSLSSISFAQNTNNTAPSVDMQARLDAFKITISGKENPNDIPNNAAIKHAIFEMTTPQTQGDINLSSATKTDAGGNLIDISTQISDLHAEFNRLNKKESAKNFNLLCNEISRQRANGEQNSYALSEVVSDIQTNESIFIENYYNDLLAKLPWEQAEKLKGRVKMLKHNMTHSRYDYNSIATDDEQLLFTLFERRCKKFKR